MEEKNIDWSIFTVEIPINAENDKIVKAWTTPEGLESWFLRLAEFTQPGGVPRKNNEAIQVDDTYKWLWHGWPDDTAEYGTVIEPEDNEFLRFTFGKTGIVGVGITERDGETIVRLCQEKIPEDETSKMNIYTDCKSGWTFYLLNLKSILLGGLDLRNKNQNLQMD